MSRADEKRYRVETRRQLKEAKGVLAALAKQKRESLKQIKADCKTAMRAVRARVKAWRKLQAEIMKAANYGARAQARDEYEALQRKIMKAANSEAEGLHQSITAHSAHLAALRKLQKPISSKRRSGGLRGAEKQAEALEEIANNLPPEWLSAYEKLQHTPALQKAIKRSHAPGARLSATEAVLEYFHNQPHVVHDVERSIEAQAERDWNERHAKLKQHAKRKRPPKDYVPF